MAPHAAGPVTAPHAAAPVAAPHVEAPGAAPHVEAPGAAPHVEAPGAVPHVGAPGAAPQQAGAMVPHEGKAVTGGETEPGTIVHMERATQKIEHDKLITRVKAWEEDTKARIQSRSDFNTTVASRITHCSFRMHLT